jgi:hypothetical protein
MIPDNQKGLTHGSTNKYVGNEFVGEIPSRGLACEGTKAGTRQLGDG